MKLSLIIIYCDKDKKYINSLLNNIVKNIKVTHEVILIDNTTDGYKPEGEYDKNHCMNGNKYASQGRKVGATLAEGEYIWFIDGDDLVLPIDSFDYTEDMIVFNLIDSSYNEKINLVKKDYVITENIMSAATLAEVNHMLWNKFIKTEIVKQCEELVPEDLYCISSEDKLVSILCLRYTKSIRFTTEYFYDFRSGNSSSSPRKMTFEKFKFILFGYKDAENFIKSQLSPGEFTALEYDKNEIHGASYFIEKICLGATEEDVIKMIEYIQTIFSKKDLYDALCEKITFFVSINPFNFSILEKYFGYPVVYFDAIQRGKKVKLPFRIIVHDDSSIEYSPK